jgi:hypothetical protein
MTVRQRGDRLAPDGGHAALGQLVQRVGFAQRGEVASQPPLGEQPESAVDRRGAQPDQMRAPAQPLADRALLERWHPHRRHQVAANELSQHARVDAVGLARQRSDRLDLAGVGDLDRPPASGEPVAHPHRAAHHLDAAMHLFRAEAMHEPGKTVLVGRDCPLDQRPLFVKRAPRGLAGAPVDAEILHVSLLASDRSSASAESCRRGEALVRHGGQGVLHDSRSARWRASRPGGSASGRRGRFRRRRCAGRSRG